MKQKISFVCGFAFDERRENVALTRKKRGPVGMTGFWNGIGGKIELGEGARSAQSREFHEEAGVLVDVTRWTTFHFERKLRVPDIEPFIYFMMAILTPDEMRQVSTRTDEPVKVWQACEAIYSIQSFHSLQWLIPMAIDYHRYPTEQWVEG